jgi:hypothetical protein
MATNRELNQIINRFNKDFYQQAIKIHLSEHIDYVEYLENNTFRITPEILGNRFEKVFLLKHKNQYVGIIQDRGESDLHIYVQKQCRGQTYLLQELNKTVIPYLLSNNSRKSQDMTFIHNKVEHHFLTNLDNIVSTGPLMATIQKNKKNSQFENQMSNTLNEQEFNLFKHYLRTLAPISLKYQKWFSENHISEYMRIQPFLTDYDYNEVKDILSSKDYFKMKDEFNYFMRMEEFCINICKLVYDEEEMYTAILFEIEGLSEQEFNEYSYETFMTNHVYM